MNLTEPQAGSDLSAVRTSAVTTRRSLPPLRSGRSSSPGATTTCPINVVHLVLARTPDAPEGVSGNIACFSCLRYWSTPMAPWGERNDVRCVSIEHKLGIHASPTCVMSFGDKEGAVGLLGR